MQNTAHLGPCIQQDYDTYRSVTKKEKEGNGEGNKRTSTIFTGHGRTSKGARRLHQLAKKGPVYCTYTFTPRLVLPSKNDAFYTRAPLVAFLAVSRGKVHPDSLTTSG